MLNVSAWSIRNPIPAILLFVMLCFAGSLAFRSMKIQNFPDIDLPTVVVKAALPGASPSSLENDVARRMENAIASVQGLRHITTRIQDGALTLTVEFRLEKPVQEALDDVRSAVQRVRSDLPADLREPIIQKLDIAGQPVLAYAVSSSRLDAQALSWFIDNELSRALLAVRGVGSVTRVGGVEREVRVALDLGRLQSLGLTAADVSRQLRQVQQESAGGRADVGNAEQPIRTLGVVRSAAELAAIEIAIGPGAAAGDRAGAPPSAGPARRSVRLDQIATITDTHADPRSAALLDGKPVIGFEVSRSRGESEVAVGNAVRKALERLGRDHPHVRFTEAFDFVTPVQDEYDASLMLLYEGAILAVLVVWLFLRDVRATFVSAVALPLSVVPAFIGMAWLGFSVNVVTLLALSLVIGILVDDAIVEVENIVRHLRMGKTPYQAAMEAADEIGLAVIATTFTLLAVFLPTAFMSGIAGKFFKQFGWTASLAVFASLVVARMLTPMMAAYLLKPIAASGPEHEPRWIRAYLSMAQWCLRHKLITLLGSFAFFAGSIALIPMLPKGFLPADDNSQTQVSLELQPGSTPAQTLAVAEEARARLVHRIPEVRSVYTTIGAGSAGADPFAAGALPEVRKATLTIQLKPRGERERKQPIEARIRAEVETLPGVRIKVGLGSSGEKYVLVLSSGDANALQAAAQQVERDLRTIPGLGSIVSSASVVRPEIRVRTDFARAADLGVTSAAIGETLRIATLGDYDAALPKLNLPERQIPIVVRLDDRARSDLSLLERLTVPGNNGPVMLAQVASVELAGGPAVIDRYDRARNVSFEIELSGVPLGEATEAVKKLPSIRSLPPGVQILEVGDAEVMGELFASFGLAMLTGLLCIYAVLVLLFRDLLHPVTILAALPLSLGGAFVGLLLANQSFSMPSLIGLIMLMGIATKNSILLVEYAIVARRGQPAADGRPAVLPMPRLDALVDACRKRARPIVMTTIAMGAGMLPIAMQWGTGDGSFRSPMAIAVIGGLITSTFLSLLVIPVVFLLIDDVSQFIARLFRRSPDRPADVPHNA
jgi:multidrug efflux pump subunit AcrB